jgi:tetratricopeptide (TPR) repeat protein
MDDGSVLTDLWSASSTETLPWGPESRWPRWIAVSTNSAECKGLGVQAAMSAQMTSERTSYRQKCTCSDCVPVAHASGSRQEGRERVVTWVRLTLLCMALLLPALASYPAYAQSSSEDLFQEGRESLATGDIESAIERFSTLLNAMKPQDPRVPIVRVTRAKAYIEKGDLKAAWKDMHQALRSSEASGETRSLALHLRGYINLRRNRDQAALRDFTQAIKVPHGNTRLRAESFAHRGVVYTRLGRYDKAVSDLNQAIRLDPNSSYAYASRGLAYLRKDKIEMARHDARTALRMDPDAGAAKMANKVLSALAISFSGPDRVSIPIGADGHLFVRVRFGPNGKPHRFLLDTGATYSLVSKDLLRQISNDTQVLKMGRGRVRTADGLAHVVIRYRVRDVFLYNIPLGDIEVHVLEGKQGSPIHLLGARSLKNIAITMNPAQGKAELRLVESQ